RRSNAGGVSISSQASGTEIVAPGRARVDQAATAVAPRVLRSQSTRTFPCRRAFETFDVYFFGSVRAIASAIASQNALQSSQPASATSGTHTWSPFPPVVFGQLSRPKA